MTREELNKEIQTEIEGEQKKEKKKKRIKFLIKLFVFLFLFLFLFYSYTTFISTVKIGVREYRIHNKKVPDSMNGLKIIQFSDLHFGSTMTLEHLKKVRKLSNDRNPDIVVFTGDLLFKNYELTAKEQELMIQELQKMKASLGKYAILGDQDTEKVATIFNQSNFQILRNDYDLIYKEDSNPILLVGLNSIKKDQNIDNAYRYFKEATHNSEIMTITMLHEPDTVDEIPYSTDLFLAGHSHNGDIRIPFSNTSLKKKEGALKYNQEYYELNKSKLYISSGLGTEKGFRLFCRPTINFFRISNY